MKLKINKGQTGITLIALVVTIIVLLILAGISINMLMGQNGILNRAVEAKEKTEQTNAKEKIELAVTGALAKSNGGAIEIDNLKSELSNYGITIEKTEFPIEVETDGQKLVVNKSGKITTYREMEEITGKENTNTATKDKLGNYIVVPAGFKIVNPTDNVMDGIIIEDVNHESTKESQFVWIPVGNVIKDDKGNIETVKLGRYVFDENGNANEQESKINLGYGEVFIEENASNHKYANIIAKDIDGFKTKAIDSNGYYVGRYEARTSTKRTGGTTNEDLTQITERGNEYVYNYVTQAQAAKLSREMYKDSNFESDLINSYAWDTTVMFLQKFDNRENRDKVYSRQDSLNDENMGLVEKGTNDLDENDLICNIYDMASNCCEWTTETYNLEYGACTGRGGSFSSTSDYTGGRGYHDIYHCTISYSFRPIIYVK